jgi:TRAP-type C4-dicarboxylate transport system permease small subunit
MAEPSADPPPPTAAQRGARALESVVAVLSKVFLALAGLTTAAVFGLVCYSVFMRYFLGQPQPWVDEAVGWLLVIMVMLAIPEVQRRGDHIGVDFLAARLSERGKAVGLTFGLLLVLFSAAIFVAEGIEMVEFSRMIGILSNQIPEIPLWMVQAFVPLGFALMLLVVGTQLIVVLTGQKPRDLTEGSHGAPK